MDAIRLMSSVVLPTLDQSPPVSILQYQPTPEVFPDRLYHAEHYESMARAASHPNGAPFSIPRDWPGPRIGAEPRRDRLYRVAADGSVEIVNIFHGGRDYQALYRRAPPDDHA
jgi:hypothetical protein